jgi:hypothetical protein
VRSSLLCRAPLLSIVLVAAASCRDLPLEARAEPPGAVAGMSHLIGCRVDLKEKRTQCLPLDHAAEQVRGFRMQIIPNAQWMVETGAGSYTPGDSTYRLQMRVVNDSPDAMGTPDGSTVTGIKVFLPFRPMGYHGNTGDTLSDPYGVLIPPLESINNSVHARNPDGVQSFTRADQPFWHYPELIQPGAVTNWREWQFTLHPEVSVFYFSVGIFAAAPGEPTIPAEIPNGFLISNDSLAALYAPSRSVYVHPRMAGPYPPDVVLITFQPGAALEEKQAALDVIGGRVIGGLWGAYYVLVPPTSNSSEPPVWIAIDRLSVLPQVRRAIPDVTVGLINHSRLPNDGAGWTSTDWNLHAALASGPRWGHEAIELPLAWGCEVGNDSATVAVLDLTDGHSRWVYSIVAASVNDNVGMAGTMWNGRVTRADASRAGTATTPPEVSANIVADIRSAFQDPMHVLNFSWGQGYFDSHGNQILPNPGDSSHVVRADNLARQIRDLLVAFETEYNHRPLYVIAAGNNRVDARMAGLPQLAADAALRSRVVVVGGTEIVRTGLHRTFWTTVDPIERGSNFSATLVEIVAPAGGVRVDSAGVLDTASGTSFAAPYVSGVAGLLRSFDPRLSADSLKILILEGARRSRWHSVHAGTTYPHLNAYEALRAAAARRTAPLCGNPIFQDSIGNVHVRRDTLWMSGPDSAAVRLEMLFTTADTLPEVMHGGKRIRFAGGNGREWALVGAAPVWESRTGMADTVANATLGAKNGHAHALPTTPGSMVSVTKTRISSTQERFDVSVNGVLVRSIDGPLAQAAQNRQSHCVYWPTAEGPGACYPGYTRTSYTDSLVTTATVGFSPVGDTVVLAISRDSVAFFVDHTISLGADSWRPHGLDRKTLPTTMYHISVATGGYRSWQIDGAVERVGSSENGRELALQVRSRFSYTSYPLPGEFLVNQANVCTGVFTRADGQVIFRSPARNLTFFGVTRACYPSVAFAP